MAEAKPPSTSDLFLLIAGLKTVKKPDVTADSGDDYYLNQPERTKERTLRETDWNQLYLNSPQFAWNQVRFRDWLMATVFENIAGRKHDFVAIAEPVIASQDLLGKTFTRDMAGGTDAIRQALISDSGLERSFFSTLTFGISKQKVGIKEVFVFGAGMRRRVELWLTSEEALKVDVEFFVPFSILPNSEHGHEVSSSYARSICAGIAVSNSKGHALGKDENKELVAKRKRNCTPSLERPRSRFKGRSRTGLIGKHLPDGKSSSKSSATDQTSEICWLHQLARSWPKKSPTAPALQT